MPIAGIYRIRVARQGSFDKYYICHSSDLTSRRRHHLGALRSGTHFNKQLQRAYNKYGEHNVSFEIMLICVPDRETLAFYEQLLVNSVPKRQLLNVWRKCVTSRLGVKDGAETRKRKSIGQKARSRTPAEREALRQHLALVNTGRVLSPASRQKMSASVRAAALNPTAAMLAGRKKAGEKLRGIKRSAEFSAKLSLARKGKKLPGDWPKKMVATRKARHGWTFPPGQTEKSHAARRIKAAERGSWFRSSEPAKKGHITRKAKGWVAKRDKNGRFC